MMTIEGLYYDGLKPIGIPAKMVFDGQETHLMTETLSEQYPAAHLKISPRMDKALRFIALPNGTQFACHDHDYLDALPQESPSEGPVSWLEKRWGIALACVAIIFCTLLAAYFFGLPFAAERIAARIPVKTEQTLGIEALSWLDKNKWFKPTEIDPAKRKTITEGFDRLRQGLPLETAYRLEFRSGKMFGPNALTFPGGVIIITDDMVNAAQSEEEVMAVLAHEIGHVELRHTMRSLLQNSIVAVVTATITSDAATLGAAVAGFPALLAQTKYSREFETAADEYAFKLLKKKGYSPTAFATLMQRFAEKYEDKMGSFAYISTHPITEERIRRSREAAAQ